MDDPRLIPLLESIDASLRLLVQRSNARAAAGPKPVASDRDLDGQYGNPQVKFNPRDWSGVSCKGRPMSECPPDFLDLLAATFDYFGDQAEKKDERTDAGKPVAAYKRADAARARGWAKRIRDGKHTPRHDMTRPTTMAQATPAGWSDDAAEEWAAQH